MVDEHDFSALVALFLSLVAFACIIAIAGCTPHWRCREAADLATHHELEICEARECRDLTNGRFITCP